MPTLAQVRSVVDARLTDLWTNVIRPRQAIYFGNRGRFWQGIITTRLTLLPDNRTADAETAEVAPDTAARPTDQAESWVDAGVNVGATLPMALQIDAYDGPNGRGFVATAYVKHNGNVYARAQEHHESGAAGEPWRTHGWRVLAVAL